VLIARGHGTLRFYDEHDYDAIARALASGHGFSLHGAPTAFRAPAGPAAIALVYAAIGARPWVFEVLQAFALATVPFAVARLARVSGLARLGGLESRRDLVPNLAGALAAAHPGLSYAASTLYPTVLTTVALAWGLAFAASAIAEGGRARAAGGGLALALAGLATTYFAPIAGLVALVSAGRRRFAEAAILALVGLAPAAAWAARNHAELGVATLSTNGGYNLALGANDQATPRSGNWIEPDLATLPDGEVARDAAYRSVATRWIRAHPARFGALSLGRALAVVDSVGKPRTAGAHDAGAARLLGWAMLPLTLLGLAGLFVRRRSLGAQLAMVPLALVIAGSAATIVKPRFRFPCDPLLAIFAIEAAAVAAGALRTARTRKHLATQANPDEEPSNA
jgi:hypothetical protein